MELSTPLYWEHVEIGRVLETDTIKIDVTDIRSFAKIFDPQPYHLDREAGEASLFRGLCASGWHISALTMKLVSAELIKENISLVGSKKVPWLEWYRPVFDGDSICAKATIKEKSHDEKERDVGLIGFDIDVHNQDDKKVMSLSAYLMVQRETYGSD